MEFVEADCVVARLVLDPEQVRLARDFVGAIAQPRAGRMQRNLRNGRPDGEHSERWTAAKKIGIARERACDEIDHEYRAETVADDDDLVGLGGLGAGDEALSEAIEPRLDIGPAAAHVVARKDPVGETLLDPPPPPGPAQQQPE